MLTLGALLGVLLEASGGVLEALGGALEAEVRQDSAKMASRTPQERKTSRIAERFEVPRPMGLGSNVRCSGPPAEWAGLVLTLLRVYDLTRRQIIHRPEHALSTKVVWLAG